MKNDEVFFSVNWVASTDYWIKKAVLQAISVEIIRDLLTELNNDLFQYKNITCPVIIENTTTYFGIQSLYLEYSWDIGTSIINVTDFEFFEPNNISDAILDKLNDMKKLAEKS
jgi:hypothetical protein